MSRAAIFDTIYALLLADQGLLDLLGPVTTQNLRLYRSYPQMQPLLGGYEPARDEGWLVIDEPDPALRSYQQLDSAWEVIEPTFSIVATRFSLCDDVSDRIDHFFHWTVEQQRDMQFDERIVLFTRRYRTKNTYNTELKLYNKVITYFMSMVVIEQID